MIEQEASNITSPLKNTDAMKCIAVLAVTVATQTQDLEELFENAGAGHYFSLEADGTKVYFAFGATPGSLDERATGNGNTVCYPLADGAEKHFRLVSGRETSTNIATLSFYKHLHWKCATGTATGYLRIYRSSLGPSQGSEQFKAP